MTLITNTLTSDTTWLFSHVIVIFVSISGLNDTPTIIIDDFPGKFFNYRYTLNNMMIHNLNYCV